MFHRLIIGLFTVLCLGGCVSIDDAGRAYFRQGSKVKGVEPADSLVERMNTDQKLRDIMYGQQKSSKILQCTLLRNQLYVASIRGSKSEEIADAVKLMEHAYQESDAAFLVACDQIGGTPVGKTFLAIQHQYLSR